MGQLTRQTTGECTVSGDTMARLYLATVHFAHLQTALFLELAPSLQLPSLLLQCYQQQPLLPRYFLRPLEPSLSLPLPSVLQNACSPIRTDSFPALPRTCRCQSHQLASAAFLLPSFSIPSNSALSQIMHAL